MRRKARSLVAAGFRPGYRTWCRIATARKPCSPAAWTSRHSTASWLRSKRSAWTSSRSGDSHLVPNRQECQATSARLDDRRSQCPHIHEPCHERLEKMNVSDSTVAIIGTGNIGSTLAANLAAGGQKFLLAGREQEKAHELAPTLRGYAAAGSLDQAGGTGGIL